MNLLCAKKTGISFSALPVPRRNGNVRPNSFCILLCARTGILDQNLQPSAFCKPMQESLCSEWAKVCATPRQICSMNILTWSWWSPQAADLPMYWFASRLATNSIASTEWSKMFSVLSCKSWVLFPPYELSTVSHELYLRNLAKRWKQSKTKQNTTAIESC